MTTPVAKTSGGNVALTLCAVILLATALHLARVVFEPVAFGALDPADPDDVAAREIDRDATRLLQAAAAAGEPEAGLAAFIGLWNGQDWDRLPDRARAALGRLAVPQVAGEGVETVGAEHHADHRVSRAQTALGQSMTVGLVGLQAALALSLCCF